MQEQGEANTETPFDIIHNARSSKATRSRKSSFQMERNQPRPKVKKLRKMTLNPESIHYQQIREIQEKNEKGPGSMKAEIKEEEFSVDDFLDLGPRRIQSQKEQMLQNGIFSCNLQESELDSDFRLGRREAMEQE